MPSPSLTKYQQKRDFSKTSEPSGTVLGGDGGRFVVHKHSATADHYDLRLEIGGVLKSWAVPKGPSLNPADKRYAAETEDHPIEYLDFEGVIPEGEYGGGTVIVWDHGVYEPLSHDRKGRSVDFEESLEHGHARFRLRGSKLHGEYALTRFRGEQDEGKEAWLLVRAGGARPDGHGTPDPRRARSVTSGRTLAQVAADAGEQ
jgi:DNA ligase D-like protein (predicted 3'-phosphoesterase)